MFGALAFTVIGTRAVGDPISRNAQRCVYNWVGVIYFSEHQIV